MRRLLAADLLPERAGQPVKAWVHISLADLRALDRALGAWRRSGSPASGRRWAGQRGRAGVR